MNQSDKDTKLFVSYDDKDKAKELGAKWDTTGKTWYAPAGTDLDQFKQWLNPPAEQAQDQPQPALASENPDTLASGEIQDGATTQPTPEGERTNLYVPYEEKDQARELGAKWSRADMAWYVPPGVDTAPFKQWLNPPAEQAQDQPQPALASENPDTLASGGPPSDLYANDELKAQALGQMMANERSKAQDQAQEQANGQVKAQALPTPEGERTKLYVSFDDKEKAKELGAKWDTEGKTWYAPAGTDTASLKQWLTPPVEQAQGQAQPAIASQNPDTLASLEMSTSPEEFEANNAARVAVHNGSNAQDKVQTQAPPTPEGERTKLYVSFDDKEKAKELGAKWDIEGKTWYAPAGTDTAPLKQWLTPPAEQAQGQAQAQEQANGQVKAQALPTPEGERTKLYVSFDDKEKAKELGAKWDTAEKTWYAPAGTDTAPLKQWLNPPAEQAQGQAQGQANGQPQAQAQDKAQGQAKGKTQVPTRQRRRITQGKAIEARSRGR